MLTPRKPTNLSTHNAALTPSAWFNATSLASEAPPGAKESRHVGLKHPPKINHAHQPATKGSHTQKPGLRIRHTLHKRHGKNFTRMNQRQQVPPTPGLDSQPRGISAPFPGFSETRCQPLLQCPQRLALVTGHGRFSPAPGSWTAALCRRRAWSRSHVHPVAWPTHGRFPGSCWYT
jgi:hypothetical protein